MNTHRPYRQLLAPLALAAGFGCAHHQDSLTMNLNWSPSSDPGDVSSMAASAFSGQKLQVMPFVDQRTVKEIGSNTQEVAPRPVTAPDDVAAYVTAHVSDVLQAGHILLVQSGPTRILQGALTQFFVKEDNTYNGTIAMNLTLTDGQGKQLWQGVATGHSKRFGKSLSADNYNETLSEAIIEVVKDLMKDTSFLDAAHGK